MRTRFLMALTGLIVISAPVLAGNLTYAEGKASWQSTQCKEPAAPPSLLKAHHETSAEKMNVLMTQYNAYTQQMQAYMDCIASEAQADSNTANQAITGAAQAMISEAQQKVTLTGEGLQKK
jgi:hypothetical protein